MGRGVVPKHRVYRTSGTTNAVGSNAMSAFAPEFTMVMWRIRDRGDVVLKDVHVVAASVEQDIELFEASWGYRVYTRVVVVRASRLPLCTDPPCGAQERNYHSC